ncbi:cardiolipin synthase [Fictibacillus barbaricus]|uniref:Cardiolipin synthase n=1 Tax=Fictibacillus barbaricus TaxID=182136 RepID=A0ABU1U376_9BACL|nr:cardiolipin synthase [Fictibacillus barbaricus]MDR7073887.1 cardiolipin synthase [Fictibacillus barbaricus]
MWIVLMLALLVILVGIDFYYGHKRMISLEKPPFRAKGDMQFLSTGYHLFDALFEDVKNAEHYIHMQFYIFRDDELGTELCQLLRKKAQEGVEVRLLVDYLGSRTINKQTIADLTQAGVHFQYSNKPGFPFFLYRINHRNHRKITVVDGVLGFIGGYNVGNEYLGKNTKFGDWRDYHLRLEGPIVSGLENAFIADWNLASGEEIQPTCWTNKETATSHNKDFMLVGSNGKTAYRFFYEKIQRSRKSIFIGSPYFIPGKKMNGALLRALQRGVSVTLLVPMHPDHPFVQEASYRYLEPLLQAGAVIYQFHEGFYHSKVLIFDEAWCDIGTANFDFRSFFFNDEINCIITDKNDIQEVKKGIESDLARSEKLTIQRLEKTQTLWVRLKEGIAFILSPML